MPDKNITIADIARSAQVSKTTVSRYLNGKYEYMSPQTKERIRSIIELANYQPNNIARSLKSHKSTLIGLVIADIESPFSSAVIKRIGDCFLNMDYNIITANCDNSYNREIHYLNSLVNQQIDGLIVNTTNRNNPMIIDLANKGMPIVLLDRFIDNYTLDIVYFQNEHPINNAMEHLVKQGYGTLHFFVQPYEQISPRFLRRDAFIKKLTSLGIENPVSYVHQIDSMDTEDLKRQLDTLMQASLKVGAPPAIIASNGVTLLHMAKAIRSLGLEMPHEVGLCGYDEWGWETSLGWAGLIDVGLTTLECSTYILGDSIAELLLRRLEKPDEPKVTQGVEVPLVIRPSTLHGGKPVFPVKAP